MYVCKRPIGGQHVRYITVGMCLSLSILFSGVAAVAESSAGGRSFDIKAQPLHAALDQYTSVSGVQVLYDASYQNLRSAPVTGVFTPDEALRRLLGESTLSVLYTNDTRSAAVLYRPGDQGPNVSIAVPPGDAEVTLETLRLSKKGGWDRFRLYGNAMQAHVLNVLQSSPETREGSYRAGLKLWIDPDGTIRQTSLFRSSGDTGRDDVIERLLRGTRLETPPPQGLPQPVGLVATIKSIE
ncbi:TonB C-terminal domain-containing protein [Tepidicaulis sp. LMO-SS28]|uniref:TonB C-terminal domain-containing protein n=1 Tax=Tepidicaulis sp. LMO-SS28 TaxID=3447455 RepID=UPI003EE35D92